MPFLFPGSSAVCMSWEPVTPHAAASLGLASCVLLALLLQRALPQHACVQNNGFFVFTAVCVVLELFFETNEIDLSLSLPH